jgi:ferritin-like protein
MNSKSETGHAKNVANFEDLISFCTAYGASYNPSKASITLTELNALYQSGLDKIALVTTTKNSFDNATGIRQTAFAPLKPLATKVINALSATDALDTVVKDARTINRKLQGTRAPGSNKVTPTSETPVEESSKTISASQQSYDRLIDSFAKLIDLLTAEANYIPNESGLKTVDLKSNLKNLIETNTAVILKYTEYSNARIDRDKVLYSTVNNLIDLALDVKKYVKSVFGASSPEFHQVSSLKFTRPRK